MSCGLNGRLSNSIPSLKGTLSKAESGKYTPYSGTYDVTPEAFNEQILLTANKYLDNNIIVRKVPYVETHNQDGITAYIAKEA